MKLSILLPTLFPELARQAIESVYRAEPPSDFEIVVVSPYHFSGPHIVSVPEEGGPKGATFATDRAYQHATGDVVVGMADDTLLDPGCLRVGLAFFLQRERNFPLYACGLNYTDGNGRGWFGTAFGMYCVWFPMVRKTTVDRVGGFYSPEFVGGWGDVDLSLRIWQAGGRCEHSVNSRLRHIPNRAALPESEHKYSRAALDLQAFVRKWGPAYGRDWNVSELRNFNIDLPEEALVDHTFRYNGL